MPDTTETKDKLVTLETLKNVKDYLEEHSGSDVEIKYENGALVINTNKQ